MAKKKKLKKKVEIQLWIDALAAAEKAKSDGWPSYYSVRCHELSA